MPFDVELLNEIIAVRQRQHDIKAESARIDKRAEELESIMISQMEEIGLTDLTIGGVRATIKYGKTARAKAPRDLVVKAFYEAGLADMLYETWPSSTISAMYRNDEVPAALEEVFESFESKKLSFSL